MLRTKFRGNRSTVSGEDFLNGKKHMGVAAILVMTQMPRTNFRSPLSMEVPHKIWL